MNYASRAVTAATEEERARAQHAVRLHWHKTKNTQDTATHFRVNPSYVLAAMNRYKRPDGRDLCPSEAIHEILRRAFL